MRTVKVTFPDGEQRDVPAIERIIESREIPPRPPRVELEPAPDTEWRFTPVVGGWIAQPRRPAD
jgi:hypothetical protein